MTEIICFDFDGVLHAYTTPWEAAHIIPDGCIPGSIEALLEYSKSFRIAIFSARSNQLDGIPSMQTWLKKQLISWIKDTQSVKDTIRKYELANYKPESDNELFELDNWASNIIRKIEWPVTKLPSKLYIDDNGFRFTGRWPSVKEINNMESWVTN